MSIRRRGQEIPLIRLEGEAVRLGSSLSYLGITLENKGMMFRAHLRGACAKTHRVMFALCRLISNIRGSSEGKRRLFADVVQSVLPYGLPSWAPIVLNARNTERGPRGVGHPEIGKHSPGAKDFDSRPLVTEDQGIESSCRQWLQLDARTRPPCADEQIANTGHMERPLFALPNC